MEKVRPWCGQPSDPGWLKSRTEQIEVETNFLTSRPNTNVQMFGGFETTTEAETSILKPI